jgi:hypothetical protein
VLPPALRRRIVPSVGATERTYCNSLSAFGRCDRRRLVRGRSEATAHCHRHQRVVSGYCLCFLRFRAFFRAAVTAAWNTLSFFRQ